MIDNFAELEIQCTLMGLNSVIAKLSISLIP